MSVNWHLEIQLPTTNLLVVTVLQIKKAANAYLRLGFVFGLFQNYFLSSLVLFFITVVQPIRFYFLVSSLKTR